MTKEEALAYGNDYYRDLISACCEIDKKHKEFVRMSLEALEQAPKTGHWIDTGSGQECSECGEIQYGYDSFRYFCAKCGAKMESEG